MLLKINIELTYLLHFFYALVHIVCNGSGGGGVLFSLHSDRFQFSRLTAILLFQRVSKSSYFHNDHSSKICLLYLSFKISSLISFFQICNVSSFHWSIYFIFFLRLLIFFEMAILFVSSAQRNFNRCALRFCRHIRTFLVFFFSLRPATTLKSISMNSLR